MSTDRPILGPGDPLAAPHPMDLDTALRMIALGAPMPDLLHREIERTLVAQLNHLQAQAAGARQAAARIDAAFSHGVPSGSDDPVTSADWHLILRYARGERAELPARLVHEQPHNPARLNASLRAHADNVATEFPQAAAAVRAAVDEAGEQ